MPSEFEVREGWPLLYEIKSKRNIFRGEIQIVRRERVHLSLNPVILAAGTTATPRRTFLLMNNHIVPAAKWVLYRVVRYKRNR